MARFGWPIGIWCVSQVTDMSGLFADKATFNEDLSGWDVSSVVNMKGMFQGTALYNQDLCSWSNKFPYGSAVDIFEGSGCTFTSTPLSQQGPFCASTCVMASEVSSCVF